MKYIGIDLGTTNSAICSYDGENVRIFKSPEQNDVTPSAIYFDKRGNKHVGTSAYRNAVMDPGSAALKFKRVIGTSTPIKINSTDTTLTPEQCSAEILKVLYSYLPEEIRNSSETGTVITVPAAFNQMQKDATMSAAEMAGLGRVALMQEPVAAVMSVMRQRKGDGIFIVYDLGGGTLDVAIAESISGRVSLLAHGGIAMCGGSDFDRIIADNVVRPWLRQNFSLPEDFSSNAQYKNQLRVTQYAAEKAKIDLSQRETTKITATEVELGAKDSKGNELYMDIPFDRAQLDALILPMIEESIRAVRETMEKANLSAQDIDRIVFVGGPTHYKPLRDKVAFELGIAASTDVNPMTAVAEGAAVFAESLNWDTASRERKSTRGTLSAEGGINLSFSFMSRTPDTKAKILAKLGGQVLQGVEFQIDSLDTGWSSGKIPLKDGASIEVSLSKPGDNTFKVFVFDAAGGPIALANNRLVITRTAATVDAIPSSSSIGIAALNKLGGSEVLAYFVKDGDPLPKKGKEIFKAAESLRAGSSGSLNFKIFEGDISSPVTDNEFIGTFRIEGTDFEDGVIPAGADLHCDYEVLDSGNIILKVSVPSIGGSFTSKNYYSSKAGQIDYTKASKHVVEEAEKLRERLDAVAEKVDDPNLSRVADKLERASNLHKDESDPETTKMAMDAVQEAKKIFALVREENKKDMRQVDLERCIEHFERVKEFARPTEVSGFETLVKSAQRVIGNQNPEFESLLRQLWGKVFDVLFRQDWFIVDRFKWMAESSHLFVDKKQYEELVNLGMNALEADDVEKLRQITGVMDALRINSGSEQDMIVSTNIVRG